MQTMQTIKIVLFSIILWTILLVDAAIGAPLITSTNPFNREPHVGINNVITVSFSEPMDESTITPGSFYLTYQDYYSYVTVPGSVSYNNGVATFTPVSNLEYGTTYYAYVTADITNLSGTPLQSDYSWSFSTSPQLRVTSTAPAEGAVNVDVNITIAVAFSEAIDPSTITADSFYLTYGGYYDYITIPGSVYYTNGIAICTPAAPLDNATLYKFHVTPEIKNMDGTPLQNVFTWEFTTAENTPSWPSVRATSPSNDESYVHEYAVIAATFSEPIDPATVTNDSFYLTYGGLYDYITIPGSAAYTGGIAAFTPSGPLDHDTVYKFHISSEVRNLAGTPIPADYTWEFDTTMPTSGLSVSLTHPSNGDMVASLTTSVSAAFSIAMDPTTINTDTFYLTYWDYYNYITVPASVSYNNGVATLTPTSSLMYGRTYQAHITTGVQNLSGEPLQTDFSWWFTTSSSAQAPQVMVTSPAQGSTNVSVNAHIGVVFSEDMDPVSINASSFYLSHGSYYTYGNVDGTVTYNDGIATFVPASPLAPGRTYTIHMTTDVQSPDGKNLISNAKWSFSTAVSNTTAPSYSQQKLTASDGEIATDYFGQAVSMSGNYAVVGAYADDDNGTNSGAAYIFERNGGTWIQQAKITAADGTTSDYFGISVSISGVYVIVGSSSANDYTGSAYIFERSGGNWIQQAKITATDGAASDYFGSSVSISGNYAIVGASGDDDNGHYSGSAYIFERSGSVWFQRTKIRADDGAAYDSFGSSVSISGNYAIVGARGDDDNGYYSGSAYIFERSGSVWPQRAKITADDGAAYDRFGFSVSLYGDYAIVGATGDDDRAGAAYMFKRNDTTWTQWEKLTALDGLPTDGFGYSVSLSRDCVVVGSPGYNGDGMSGHAGSAYLFKRTGDNWIPKAKLTTMNSAIYDNVGSAVSSYNGNALIGASRLDAAYLFISHQPLPFLPLLLLDHD